jgi:hypothetical protein
VDDSKGDDDVTESSFSRDTLDLRDTGSTADPSAVPVEEITLNYTDISWSYEY